jgi:hypothetical protein
VPVKVTGPAGGKVTLKARRGKKVVATASGTANASGVASLKLKFNKAGKKALRRAKSARLTVDVVYKPAGGETVKGQTRLTLKR